MVAVVVAERSDTAALGSTPCSRRRRPDVGCRNLRAIRRAAAVAAVAAGATAGASALASAFLSATPGATSSSATATFPGHRSLRAAATARLAKVGGADSEVNPPMNEAAQDAEWEALKVELGLPGANAAAARAAASTETSIANGDTPKEYSDGSWAPEGGAMSDMLRMIPGSALEDRKVLKLGEADLRKKSKMIKEDRITNKNSTNVAGELVRVLRGPDLPGRTRRGGSLVASQLGVPSRLICVEETEGEMNQLPPEQRAAEGRLKPFCKVIFNPRMKPVADEQRTAVGWERDPSVPGYRALVERQYAVQVAGVDPYGVEVKYVAKGHEARLLQQAIDALDGVLFTDRCLTRSLRHLDSRDDPLPPDLPPIGVVGEATGSQLSEAELVEAAEKGGGKGFLAGVPVLGRPDVYLAGSLLLRIRSPEVAREDVEAGIHNDIANGMKEALKSGKHPLGIAATQMGRRMRAIAVGESEEFISKMGAMQKVTEEHFKFGPLVLFNPVVKPTQGCSSDAYFFERTPTVPGYEAVVCRATQVDVEGITEEGEVISFTAKGWQARMIQHTVDILDGVLYVDKMERRSFRLFRKENWESQTGVRLKEDGSVRRAQDLPEDVPYGVKTARRNFDKTDPKKLAKGKAASASKASGARRSSPQKKVREPKKAKDAKRR